MSLRGRGVSGLISVIPAPDTHNIGWPECGSNPDMTLFFFPAVFSDKEVGRRNLFEDPDAEESVSSGCVAGWI